MPYGERGEIDRWVTKGSKFLLLAEDLRLGGDPWADWRVENGDRCSLLSSLLLLRLNSLNGFPGDILKDFRDLRVGDVEDVEEEEWKEVDESRMSGILS